MNTMSDCLEKKCYIDYLVKKYTAEVCSQKDQEQKGQYNTTIVLTNTQPVVAKVNN